MLLLIACEHLLVSCHAWCLLLLVEARHLIYGRSYLDLGDYVEINE